MSDAHHSELMQAALDYARRGWPVFPCHATGHHPLDPTRDAQGRGGFYLATTDAEQIEVWWSRWPDAAIALRTGEASGVFVMDIDPRHGGDIFVDELEAEHGPLPHTVQCQTGGGGRHIYFRHPGQPVRCSTGEIASGIDIKGEGGYVILPPSDHRSGRTYTWLLDHVPGQCPIAEAPAWLLDRVVDRRADIAPNHSSTGEHVTHGSSEAIPEGYRNKTLASIAGHLRQIGLGAEEIKAALLATNSHRCHPPLDVKEIESIARSVGRYAPDTSRQAEVEHWPERYLAESENEHRPGPVLTCLADVQPCEVEWLWPKRIAIGKITMLAGDPGLGKSFCSMDIAARVSAGKAWPDAPDVPRQPGGVIVLSAEDALDDTIRPRLDAAGADASRICAIEAVHDLDPMTGKPRRRGFHLDKDIDNLAHALRQLKDCRLVIIDPISAYLGDSNSHNNAEVRALLSPLSDLAARYRVAVLAISHLNKGHGEAMYRIMGSLAFVAAARAGYAVVKDSKDDTGQRRLILPIKNNLGDDESGLAYRIMETAGDDQPHVEWEPEVVYTTVNEALGVGKHDDEMPDSAEQKDRRRTQTAEAVDWLMSYLADGEKPARQVILDAKNDGIAQRTLERAKAQAGVVARREGFGENSRWVWRRADIEPLVEQAMAVNATPTGEGAA